MSERVVARFPEIDVARVVRTVWSRRGIFFAVFGITLLVAIVVLHILPEKHTVTMDVAPVAQNSQQSASGGLGALARLGGVDLESLTGGQAQFQLFVSAMKSDSAAARLARDQGLMHKLFPSQWSDADGTWREPSNPVRTFVRGVAALLAIPVTPWHPPGGPELHQFLSDNLEVDADPKSPIVTFRIVSAHPEVAGELLAKLAAVSDQMIKESALRRSTEYIGYLTKELETVTVTGYRDALLEHLSSQEETRMMASADVSFAAQVFSGPSVSITATSPKSVMLLLFALVAGLVAGTFAALWAADHRLMTLRPRQVERAQS